MKKQQITPLCLTVLMMLGSGCITRTVSDQPQYRGNSSAGKKLGSKTDNENVISKERIWFWQSEFRNP
ncbi:hypothetical protein P4E94_14235 [Pontiellaceae bacterium B12219]|nr:hypothetical protein [Pontiellaceae bacterium B12219]